MALSAAQHACRDRILTQAHPARIGNTVDAVVLKHGRLFMLAEDTGDVPWRRPHGYGLFDVRFERRADGRAEVAAEVQAGRLTGNPTETSPPAEFMAPPAP